MNAPHNTPAFLEAWSDWKNFRREIKKPVTATVEKYQFRQIAKWSERAAIASIERSIQNGWQGLFYPPEDVLQAFSSPQRVETPEPENWRVRLQEATGKQYEEWMEWQDVSWEDKKLLK